MGIYDAAWKRYRRLRLTFWIGAVGFLPFLFVLMLLYALKVYVPLIVVGVYLGFFAVVRFRKTFFRCPQCRQFFAVLWGHQPRPLAPECVHCGLPKFSP
jgi:hypothetical protein